MVPKKYNTGNPGRKKPRSTIQFKKEIIAKIEQGKRVTDIAKEYGMARTTVSSILKKKEAIKAANVAEGVTSICTKQRSQTLEDVEKLLLVWIKEKQLAGDAVSETIICEKAKQIHSDLQKDSPETSMQSNEFKASRGWFDNFKRRNGIQCVIRHGEAASSDKEITEIFVREFKELVESEGYLPQQVFNCDETGLFWKKMPKRTYITQEEAALPGHERMKDRISLLLCGNASGDHKVKPLLVYHSENPPVFKKHNICKNKLGVMWRANKSWVTRQFFSEWVDKVFGPSVKEYLESKNLPVKALLVLDNAPAHHPRLKDELAEQNNFIQIKFLPPSTNPIIQPMTQQVISNFKKLYTKMLFKKCFEVTSDTNLTLRDFWNSHFNILHCVRMVVSTWGEVSMKKMNSAWMNLWPDCVTSRDVEGFESEPVVEEIVSLGESMGLEVDSADVEELVEDHRREMTIHELKDLPKEQSDELGIEISSPDEDDDCEAKFSTGEIKRLFSIWSDLQCLVEKWHPDVAMVTENVSSFNENVIGYFRKIMKSREKQVSLDRFFSKTNLNLPEYEIPHVYMNGASPSKLYPPSSNHLTCNTSIGASTLHSVKPALSECQRDGSTDQSCQCDYYCDATKCEIKEEPEFPQFNQVELRQEDYDYSRTVKVKTERSGGDSFDEENTNDTSNCNEYEGGNLRQPAEHSEMVEARSARLNCNAESISSNADVDRGAIINVKQEVTGDDCFVSGGIVHTMEMVEARSGGLNFNAQSLSSSADDARGTTINVKQEVPVNDCFVSDGIVHTRSSVIEGKRRLMTPNPEKVARRRVARAAYMRQYRATQSEDRAALRRKSNAQAHRIRRSHETEEETERRRQQERERLERKRLKQRLQRLKCG